MRCKVKIHSRRIFSTDVLYVEVDLQNKTNAGSAANKFLSIVVAGVTTELRILSHAARTNTFDPASNKDIT